jgi:serine/threonine-protein kinase 24/25/MST4
MERINSAEELEVCEEVGRGAFGVVYRGLVRATHEEVAIKQIDLEHEQADLIEVNKEIQIILECRIAQITTYRGCFVKGHKLWVVMEYVDGGSLFELLKAGAVQSEAVVLAIAREILVALAYLHNQGKIHRDLKLHNILLNRRGEVKLTDFGVLTQLASNFSRRNTTVGTPYWMAPEVIVNNSGGHLFKADVWLLGCCLYELVTGKPPLQNQYAPMKALGLILRCHADGDFVRLIGLEHMAVSPEFGAFLRLCFVVDPKQRASAARLLQHRFITRHAAADHRTELKRLITKKQLWDQDHHVAKVQNFYLPTEIERNQQRWTGAPPAPVVQFDLLASDEDAPSDADRGLTPASDAGSPPPVRYHLLSRPTPKQESVRNTIRPELAKITHKVFHRLETKNNLLTGQYDALVRLNESILALVLFVQDPQMEKSPKVLICQYLRYFFKELMREGASEGRLMLQRLIVPLVLDARPAPETRRLPPTQFDEIEQSLLESWVEKMRASTPA